MTIGDVISACEYTGCVILDAFGEEIKVETKDYNDSVEHLSAKDNVVQIWTYRRWDEYLDRQIEPSKAERKND